LGHCRATRDASEFVECETLCCAFLHSKASKIRHLAMNMTSWNERMEQCLSEYVKTNAFIERLDLSIQHGALFQSDKLLAAAECGSCSLVTLKIHGFCGVEERWMERMQLVLAMNRTREMFTGNCGREATDRKRPGAEQQQSFGWIRRVARRLFGKDDDSD
jgi:hypothetical protein